MCPMKLKTPDGGVATQFPVSYVSDCFTCAVFLWIEADVWTTLTQASGTLSEYSYSVQTHILREA